MDATLRRNIIGKLMEIPATKTAQGRTSLLGGLPPNTGLNRDETNQYVDLASMVDQSYNILLDTGESALEIIIDNALDQVKDTRLGSDLKTLKDQVRKQKVLHSAGKACDFDLEQLIDDCIEALLGKQGLIGCAVPCNDAAFLSNFCERLEQELENAEVSVQVRSPLALTPKFTSAEEAVGSIMKFSGLLHDTDVLCPMQVQTTNEREVITITIAMIDKFWRQLLKALVGSFEHRLVVLMFVPEELGCAFPESVIRLSPPKFRSVHVYRWVSSIVFKMQHLDSKERQYVRDTWQDAMIVECSRGGDTLHIRQAYEHMEYTLKILQGRPTVKRFLDELEERRSYATAPS